MTIPHALPALNVSDQTSRIRRDPHRVVSVSRLIRGKRIDDAIRIFQLASLKVPSATFEIFGAGMAQDRGEVVQELKELVNELGLGGKVHFRGYTSQPIVEMASSGALLFTSESEAWGYTVAEALIAGTPVVSYSCKYGPADIISDGKTGFLVDVGDIERAAKKLVWLLKNNEKALKFGKRGQASLREKFSNSVILTAWEEVLDSAFQNIRSD